MEKKEIYIIKNDINDMVYVGQSKNAAERFSKHVYEAKVNRNGTLIDGAMHDLGYEHFYYQILESNVENFNERERYWIAQYNSLYPNGYNSVPGGIMSGFEVPNAKLDSESLNKIINLLQYSGYSNTKIANECNCGEWTVWAVNNGQAYYNPSIQYPIRKSNRYDKELIKQVKYALKYELDKSLGDIAREFNIDYSQVSEINQGKIHNFSNESYPLRSGKNKNVIDPNIVNNIINDLKNNPSLSQTDIARKYNVSCNCITGINLGRNFRDNNLDYPIRNNNRDNRNCKKQLTIPEVNEIENELLNTNLSMRQIAKKHELGLVTIQNLNNGAIVSYRKNNINYPIRSIK